MAWGQKVKASLTKEGLGKPLLMDNGGAVPISAPGFEEAKPAARRPKRAVAWSYSRWDTYNTCPAKFKYKFFDKLPDPGGPALVRGDSIHKLAEKYLKSEIDSLPEELSKFERLFSGLREASVSAEESWAFDSNWEPVEYFDRSVMVRIKVDAHLLVPTKTLRIFDWKTGKFKQQGYEPQMELYAIGGFARYGASVERVETSLVYLDEGKVHSNAFGAWQVDVLKATWARRVRKLEQDTVFAPNPSKLCQWCPFSKSKGGPCQY